MNPDATPPPVPRSVPAAALLFLTLGGAAWLAATVGLVRRPDLLLGAPAEPTMLALTHLLVLGFLSSLLFGVGYVLGPVMAAAPLWRRGLAWLHLALHGAGTAWMVLGFLMGDFAEVGYGGIMVFAGLILFFINLTATGSRFSRWEADHLAFHGGLFWLMITGAIALFIASGKVYPVTDLDSRMLLAAHAHFGFGGFVLLLLFGLTLRWIRLQAVPTARPGAPSWIGGGAIHAGLFLVFPAILPTAVVPLIIPKILLLVGTLAFLADAIRLLTSSSRRLDPSLGVVAMGLVFLVPVISAATVIPPGALAGLPGLTGDPTEWTRLYLLLGLFGPATVILTGLASRLAPQLLWQVWRHGDQPSPTLPGVAGPWVIGLSLALAWGYLAAALALAQPEGIRIAALLAAFSLVFFLFGLRPALRRAFIANPEPRSAN